MAIVEGYPELNAYESQDTDKDQELKDKELKESKEQRSLFALETQLRKTKLCRYHLKGLCKHGTDCRFAHGSGELNAPPNLTKTRLCPDMLANGTCTNPMCTFAHQETELKKVNICHKTAVCTWFLAGTCRNGSECSFAHGEHELKGNQAKKPEVDQKEPLFIKSSITAPESLLQSQAPEYMPSPYMPQENSQFHDPYSYQASQQQWPHIPSPLPPWPSAPPPPPTMGFMPNVYGNGMQPCVGGYAAPPPLMPPDPNYMSVQPDPNYMSVPPPPLMPPYASPTITSCSPQFNTSVATTYTSTPNPPSPPTASNTMAPPAPGLPGPGPPPGLGPQTTQGSDKTCQLTELSVQINLLSSEVKRLQDWIIPQSSTLESMNSGSSIHTSDNNGTPPGAQNGTPPGGRDGTPPSSGEDADPRTFEEKVAALQSELQRVMVEGQRCGKIQPGFQETD